MKHLSCAAIILLLAGCASVTTGTSQSVRFDTVRPDGVAVEGADCTATNGRRTTAFRSGLEVQIRRDKSDLNIECKSPGLPAAEGRLVSGHNYAGVGNILVGGLVGMAVDAGTGANHSYPAWVRLVFGEYRSFDRRSDETRKPMLGVVVGNPAPSAQEAPPVVAVGAAAEPAPSSAAPAEPAAAPAAPAPAPTAPVPSTSGPASNWRNWGNGGIR